MEPEGPGPRMRAPVPVAQERDTWEAAPGERSPGPIGESPLAAVSRKRGPSMRSPSQAAAPGRERLIHQLWREQRLTGKPLPADDGTSYQCVFPGWANTGAGPDFRGAILAAGGSRLVKGDVEIHVHAGDWQAHGHHMDPAFDATVLHVAWRKGISDAQVHTARGRPVPTIALDGAIPLPLELMLLAGHVPSRDPRPCVRHSPTLETLTAVLDSEGQARFFARSAGLMGEAASLGEEQALYLSIMDALGYAKNRAPFRELAERLPFRTLSGICQGKSASRRRQLLPALLLGGAALLPGGAAAPGSWAAEAAALERLWAPYEGLGRISQRWTTHRVRPGNLPWPRIISAGYLLNHFLDEGLVAGLERVVAAACRDQDPMHISRCLTSALTSEAPGSRRPAARAADIAVNVVLPFFHGRALELRQDIVAQEVLGLYRAHPALSPNAVTREMGRMLVPRASNASSKQVAGTAARQQGMVQLYRGRCRELLCQGCGAGNEGRET